MRIKSSYLIAGAVVVAIVLWFGVNALGAESEDTVEPAPFAREADLPTVVVRQVSSQTHPVRISVSGRTQPNRMVDVKAKTAASVTQVAVEEGNFVTRGTVICRQDVDARQSVVDQAKAAVAKAETDLRASERLVERGFKSPNALPGDRANLDAARAQLRQAQNELGNIVMRAPFSGIFDSKMAEVGDYLAPGQPCGRVVELDPLKVEAEVTETQVGSLQLGQDVPVTLATGETVKGALSFIESVANPATRTFTVEATLPNENLALKAGVSADLSLGLGEADATLIPSSILALNDDGNIGVRYVDASDTVRFARVSIVEETPGGSWVAGLPSTARVIVEGQDYVSEGSQVEPRREGSPGTSRLANTGE